MAHTTVEPGGGPIASICLSPLAGGLGDVATLLVCRSKDSGVFGSWARREKSYAVQSEPEPGKQAHAAEDTLVISALIREIETELSSVFEGVDRKRQKTWVVVRSNCTTVMMPPSLSSALTFACQPSAPAGPAVLLVSEESAAACLMNPTALDATCTVGNDASVVVGRFALAASGARSSRGGGGGGERGVSGGGGGGGCGGGGGGNESGGGAVRGWTVAGGGSTAGGGVAIRAPLPLVSANAGGSKRRRIDVSSTHDDGVAVSTPFAHALSPHAACYARIDDSGRITVYAMPVRSLLMGQQESGLDGAGGSVQPVHKGGKGKLGLDGAGGHVERVRQLAAAAAESTLCGRGCWDLLAALRVEQEGARAGGEDDDGADTTVALTGVCKQPSAP
jgi:hypothetical protein